MQLTVYKASAGSGKTFTLAVEYISLLVLDPTGCGAILAVTFTKKATAEMKNRILTALYAIWKGLPDKESREYFDNVRQNVHKRQAADGLPAMSDAEISRRAGIALSYLLHHFDEFRVMTIDSFFQSVLRNLARELDLSANLRVELADREVEEAAVDALIEQLDDHDKVLQWIIGFIRQRMKEDKNWNVIGDIKEFGRQLFSSAYRDNRKALTERFEDDGFFTRYQTTLQELGKQTEKSLTEKADEFFRLLEEHGLSENDFAYKQTGICSYFNKIKNKDFEAPKSRIQSMLKDHELIVSSGSRRQGDPVYELAMSRLGPLLDATEKLRPHAMITCHSVRATLRHLDTLRLLGEIEKKMREINLRENRFMLSDTQYLLHDVMQDDDAPFIYEKTGSRIRHIMIDEFQDTSRIQWENFRVLLTHCMGQEGAHNLIVGDVKQSIYRWRDGDWQLLNDIEGEFPGMEIGIERRKFNYRSAPVVIDFNNAFFTRAAKITRQGVEEEVGAALAAQLTKAYQDVVQEYPKDKKREGMVDVRLIDTRQYPDLMLQQVKETVLRLFREGYAPKDIAILVRNNKSMPAIADILTREVRYQDSPVRVVSNEAFRLSSSAAVMIIVSALRALAREDDKIAWSSLAKLYQRRILGNDASDALLFSRIPARLPEEETSWAPYYRDLLPEGFTLGTARLKRMPVYRLAESLYHDFHVSRLQEEGAYVCAFFDEINRYLHDSGADLFDLLEAWDSTIAEKKIQGDASDGIRLMTVHASKGLEYDNVIIPHCDWLMRGRGTIWCATGEKPYSDLPVIPLDNGNTLKDSVYGAYWKDELLQNTVDNLNLLYVAFTRAKRNLFILGGTPAKGNRSSLLDNVVPLLAADTEWRNGTPCVSRPDQHQEAEEGFLRQFTFGTLAPPKADAKTGTPHDDGTPRNIFRYDTAPVSGFQVESYPLRAEFRQSNESDRFVSAGDDAATYISQGTVLHRLFEDIITAADVDAAISRLDAEGILTGEHLRPDKLREMIHKRLENSVVGQWFDGHWRVYNECTVLMPDAAAFSQAEGKGGGKQPRPDRVMTCGSQAVVVDYKFSKMKEAEHAAYRLQVQNYMRLLSAMGYTGVRGYVWYFYDNRPVEIFPDNSSDD